MVTDIRPAGQLDAPFIAEIIVHAESTGFEITSYAKMLELEQKELIATLAKIVDNPTEHHALCYKSFFVIEADGTPAGGMFAYVEGANGSSNHLMTGALMSCIDRTELQEAFTFLAKHKDIHIPKTTGTLQLDCIGILPPFGGKGLFSKLLDYIEQKYKAENVAVAEIQVWKKNTHAVEVYLAKGYSIVTEKESTTETENGKILMQKKL